MGTPRELIASLKMHRLEVRSSRIEEFEKTLTEKMHDSDGLITDVQEYGDRLDVLAADADKGEKFIRDQSRVLATRIWKFTCHRQIWKMSSSPG